MLLDYLDISCQCSGGINGPTRLINLSVWSHVSVTPPSSSSSIFLAFNSSGLLGSLGPRQLVNSVETKVFNRSRYWLYSSTSLWPAPCNKIWSTFAGKKRKGYNNKGGAQTFCLGRPAKMMWSTLARKSFPLVMVSCENFHQHQSTPKNAFWNIQWVDQVSGLVWQFKACCAVHFLIAKLWCSSAQFSVMNNEKKSTRKEIGR